ncbi:MAG TPA: hypothetical protein VJ860_17390 [Polyangia bacterium]|nr:hypothetical protein [Polyangia bacterium]
MKSIREELYCPGTLYEQREDGHGQTSAASIGRGEAPSDANRAVADDA